MPNEGLAAEDRLAVMDLIARYSRTLDTADIEGWLSIWRPDAVLDSLTGAATGHEELRAWANRLFETRGVGKTPPEVIHFIGMPLVTGEGDHASSQTYTLIVHADPNETVNISLLGRYDDELVRVDGRWWIQKRTINTELRRAENG